MQSIGLSFPDLKDFLDQKADLYNQPGFIELDPICIPHKFTSKQDIEIMGFWSAMLAWGQRKTIINKCNELIRLMDGAPYDFITNHQDTDLKRFSGFKHRTFNDTDALYFVEFFKQHYKIYDSLESAFLPVARIEKQPVYRDEYLDLAASGNNMNSSASSPCFAGELRSHAVEDSLNYFRGYFFSLPDFPRRTIKHVSSPQQKSTCKRLNMFLRWMVRNDGRGVDFGIWKSIKPSDLICPTDLHVERVARKLKLITRKQVDWQTAMQLTENLRRFDPADPVKYDFALFGLGIEEQFQRSLI
ncbi:TIGR02757 family protein [Daejeonella sp. JGW-45]|uniref:TIGR02757 family protein n=1 Tax=Daejeonella sp. JGW-45 TaxID=3034148 RepID=UPI0023EBC844|nr:TIGR02757 family protein [Daejeonella sp. JGW-45]